MKKKKVCLAVKNKINSIDAQEKQETFTKNVSFIILMMGLMLRNKSKLKKIEQNVYIDP